MKNNYWYFFPINGNDVWVRSMLFIIRHVFLWVSRKLYRQNESERTVYNIVSQVVCNYVSTNIIVLHNQTFLLSHSCEPSHFAILSKGEVASLVYRYSLFVHVSPILIFTTIVLSLTGIVKYHWQPLIFFIIPFGVTKLLIAVLHCRCMMENNLCLFIIVMRDKGKLRRQ